MALEENMFFAINTTCVNDKVSGSNCENYLITKSGAVSLNTTPSELIVIDY